MPDFDFDAYNHDQPAEGENHHENGTSAAPIANEIPEVVEVKNPVTVSEPVATATNHNEEVDKW